MDINTWQIKNGKLYLNLNPEVLKLFNKDFEGYVAKAEKKLARAGEEKHQVTESLSNSKDCAEL